MSRRASDGLAGYSFNQVCPRAFELFRRPMPQPVNCGAWPPGGGTSSAAIHGPSWTDLAPGWSGPPSQMAVVRLRMKLRFINACLTHGPAAEVPPPEVRVNSVRL